MNNSTLFVALLFAQSAVTDATLPPTSALAILHAQDDRIAQIGDRLAVASVGLCATPVWRPGFDVQYLAQYGHDEAAEVGPLFALSDAAAITVIVADSGAQQAGVQRGDSLIAIDGHPLPRDRADDRPRFTATAQAMALIDTAFADGTAILTIERDGQTLMLPVTAQRGCASRFVLLPSPTVSAEADGHYVQISSAAVALAADDAELAATLAHELAHNILRHRARLNAAGVRRGLLAHVGRNAALFRTSEIEADRLSVYLISLAGYDPAAALRMIDHLAANAGPTLATTHPGWTRRRQIIGQEIARIAALQASGQPLRPDFDLSGTAPLTPDTD